MAAFLSSRRLRVAVVAGFALVATGIASATRVPGATPASGATATAPQPAAVQNDETASLREGTIGAVDARGKRVQVQGIWLDFVPGTTRLMRQGQPAGLESLKAGEVVRFTVAPGAGTARTLQVIYAP